MWSLVGIVLIIFTVTAATEANYSHKIQSYKGRLVMTKKDVTRYTSSRTGGLYDYAPLDALKYKDHLKKHEVKVGDRWENASHKAYNSKIVYTVEDADEQKSHYLYSIIGEQL